MAQYSTRSPACLPASSMICSAKAACGGVGGHLPWRSPGTSAVAAKAAAGCWPEQDIGSYQARNFCRTGWSFERQDWSTVRLTSKAQPGCLSAPLPQHCGLQRPFDFVQLCFALRTSALRHSSSIRGEHAGILRRLYALSSTPPFCNQAA